MQKVTCPLIDTISHLRYDFHWAGLKEKRQHGVGIVIIKSSDMELGSPTCKTDYISPAVHSSL